MGAFSPGFPMGKLEKVFPIFREERRGEGFSPAGGGKKIHCMDRLGMGIRGAGRARAAGFSPGFSHGGKNAVKIDLRICCTQFGHTRTGGGSDAESKLPVSRCLSPIAHNPNVGVWGLCPQPLHALQPVSGFAARESRGGRAFRPRDKAPFGGGSRRGRSPSRREWIPKERARGSLLRGKV